MESRKKASEQGWFYHAPPKAKPVSAQEEYYNVPAASQIPGLTHLPQLDANTEGIRGTIKDTDSPYVVLAKEGGRKDLLVFHDPKPLTQDAKGYPRVDWFYLEDNRQEAAENTIPTDYQASVPEYMVHEEFMGADGQPIGSYSAKHRAPYSFGNDTVYDREGQHGATDKTVRLQEAREFGYGVRSDKLKGKVVKHNTMPKMERGKAPEQQIKADRTFEPAPAFDDSEKPIMSKILSFGYAKDWSDKRETWDKVQSKRQTRSREGQQGQMAGTTEYQEGFMQKSAARVPKAGRRAVPAPVEAETFKELETMAHKTKTASPKTEPFKMKRFQNVPAKTDSNRHTKQVFQNQEVEPVGT